MNKQGIFIWIISCFILGLHTIGFCSEPIGGADSLKRTVTYHPEGTVASITVTRSDKMVEKFMFDKQGVLVRKQLPDGVITEYKFNVKNGHKIAVETYSVPEKKSVKRIFDNKDRIIGSEYAEYNEKYTYTYNERGNIKSVKIQRNDGQYQELPIDDKYLTFLRDYDIVKTIPFNIQKQISEREYLYNPRRYREKLQMNRQYRQVK